MTAARNFSSTAVAATLTAPLNATDTVAYVSDVTGWPTAPFSVVVDKDRSPEEVVTVTAVIGLSITVTRGEDGTSAVAHDVGAPVVHGVSARDFRDAAVHVAATAGSHGVTGNLVGDTDTQTIQNKTFTNAAGSAPGLIVKQGAATSGQTLDIRTSSNTSVGGFDVAGRVNGTGLDVTGTSIFTAGDAATVPVTIKMKAGQTANPLNITTSAGSIVMSVGADGSVYAPNLTQSTLNATSVVANTISTVTLTATSAVATGPLTATGNIASSGNVVASGNVSGVNGTFSGTVSGATVTSSGAITGSSLSVGGGISGGTGSFGSTLSQNGGAPVPIMAAGTATVSLSAASFGAQNITFPGGRFAVTPIATATINNSVTNSSKLNARIINLSTGGATVQVYTGDGSSVTATGVTVGWVAVQMTTGSAAG